MSDDSSVEHDDEEISDDQTSGPDDASSASAQPQKVTGEVEVKDSASSAVKAIFSMLILLGGLAVAGSRGLRKIAPDFSSAVTRLFDTSTDASRMRPSIPEQPRKLLFGDLEVESLDSQPKSIFENGQNLTEVGRDISDLYRELDQMFQDKGVPRHDLIRSKDDQRNLAILCALLHEVSIEHVVYDAKEIDRHQDFYVEAQEYLAPLPQNEREVILRILFRMLNNSSSTNGDITGNPSLSEQKVRLLSQLRAVGDHYIEFTRSQTPLP